MQQKIDGKCVLITQIRGEKFCLRVNAEDSALVSSVRQWGLLQPLTVVRNGKYFECVSGHKRLAALKKLKKKNAPVDLLSMENPRKIFLAALLLNHSASYSDLDRAYAVQKAEKDFQFSVLDLQNLILPLLGLVSSPKVLNQYQQAARLPGAVQRMIELNCLPFQGSFWLAKFKAEDLNYLVRQLLPKIRPTASQLAHICEWLLDLIQIGNKSAAKIIKQIKLAPASKTQDARPRTDAFYQSLRSLRFPELTEKEKAFTQAAQAMQGQVSGLEIRAPDHFEQEGFYIRAHIRNSKSMAEVARKLQDVQNQAARLFDTLL